MRGVFLILKSEHASCRKQTPEERGIPGSGCTQLPALGDSEKLTADRLCCLANSGAGRDDFKIGTAYAARHCIFQENHCCQKASIVYKKLGKGFPCHTCS